MSNQEALQILYTYKRTRQGDMVYAPLVVQSSSQGPLPESVIQEVLEESFPTNKDLFFNDLDDLTRFSYLLCIKAGLPKGYLLSNDKFNEFISHSHNLEDIQNYFLKEGKQVTNDEYNKSKNIFKKIFN